MSLNLAAAVGKSRLNTMIIAVKQCLPFAGLALEQHCLHVRTLALTAATTINSLTTVILSWRFGRNWVVPGASGSSNEKFVDGTSRFVHELLANGKRVIFMVDVPKLDLEPRSCIARMITLVPNSDRHCDTPMDSVKESQREYRQLVAQIAGRNPAMEVFDPLPLLCDDSACSARRGEHLRYRDADHLSIAGSARVLDSLQQFIAVRQDPAAGYRTVTARETQHSWLAR